jgi:streptomycin 6-kinase
MTSIEIPDGFATRMREVYGASGREWLSELPSIVARCAERWGLEVGPPFVPLTYNWVAPATMADGTAVVLKAGYPPPPGFEHEPLALAHFAGQGCARLIDHAPELGAFVIERLTPGVMLRTLPDDAERTLIAARIMRLLWRPVPDDHPFASVAAWGKAFTRYRARDIQPLPADLVDEAEPAYAQLVATSPVQMLLHGDLHHDNILSAARAPWLAIDPKGVAGDPAYEPASFLFNPDPWLSQQPDMRAVLDARIAIFASELGLDAQRIRAWAFAQAVVSAIWTVEDHGHGWDIAISIAHSLRK